MAENKNQAQSETTQGAVETTRPVQNELSNGWSFAVGAGLGAGTYYVGGIAIGLSLVGGVFAGFGALAVLSSAGPAISMIGGLIAGAVVAGGGGYLTYKGARAVYRKFNEGLNMNKGIALAGGIAGFVATALLTPPPDANFGPNPGDYSIDGHGELMVQSDRSGESFNKAAGGDFVLAEHPAITSQKPETPPTLKV